MVENAALYATIVANPREDTPRFAYADWLDENGDSDRARFIRLQYEIEKLPPTGGKTLRAKKEQTTLLEKYGDAWAGELAWPLCQRVFRRGFVEVLYVAVETFLQRGEWLFGLAPIREVRINNIGNSMPTLAASPLLGRVETLGFTSSLAEALHFDGRLGMLLASPHLASVKRLDFAMQSLNDQDAERIAACPNLGGLVHLNLSHNSVSAAGMRALVNSDRLSNLTSLAINGNGQVGSAAAAALVDSPLADRLQHLSLAEHGFGNEPVKMIAASPRLRELITLDLSDNGITDVGAKALADLPHLTNLERLTLRGHNKTLTAVARDWLKERFGKDACVF